MQANGTGKRTIRKRATLAAATLGAAALLAVGCGSSDPEPSASTPAPTASSGSPSGTGAPGTTTEPKPSGATPGNPPGTNRTSGTAPGGTTVGVPNESIEADEVAAAVTWVSNAGEFQGRDGLLVAYDCAPDGALATVWGDGTYTDDSSVCSAAVHAGLITTAGGGHVVIEITPGEDSYPGTTANGVTSLPYATWPGSFTFPGI